MSVNVLGIVNALNAFLPDMLARGEPGHIVNTASLTGLVALQAVGTIYTASKYAVVGLSEVLRQELAATSLGVSVLCPGAVNTRILDSERNRPGGATAKRPDGPPAGLDEAYTRMIEPGEVARMTLGAIEADRLHVVTHPEWLATFRQRTGILQEAFQST